VDLFKAAMRRAVQAAAVGLEPASAMMAHESGVVTLEFIYLNGVVSNVVVVASSGFPLLDDAAVQGARNAAYPPAPPDFAGQTEHVQVDVVFRSAAVSVDSD
jgi:protein TonB